MIAIRAYHSNDVEAVTDLMADLGYPTDIQSMQNRMDAMELNPSYFTFVATKEEMVVGMIGVRLVHYYEGDGVAAQISALVTSNQYRGQGVGKELIRFVENWTKEKGLNSLHLTSGIKPERMAAHDFYKKMGFSINGYRFVKKLNDHP